MSEKYTLIIAEKPNASKKIAEALADKKPVKKAIGKVPYYELEHNGKKIVVGCAVGHLYTLGEKNKKAWHYPIYDFEWKPTYEVDKGSAFAKAYLDALKKLAKDADNFIISTDYDLEGSVIGYNILRFLCNQKDAKRMKFSTLTTDELRESYDKVHAHLDFPQIESGLARHSLDWLYGVNLSRALTLSVKHATGGFKLLSSGRVQGPALKLLSDKEKEIAAFKSEPYWELELLGEAKGKAISAWHKTGKFWDKKETDTILKKTKGKNAIVESVETRESTVKPPTPFDLTSLQIEAYSTIGLTPQQTMIIAQDLYSNGWISYPRTSSQKLPPALNYKKILEKLKKRFNQECTFLLNKTKLIPHEGEKVDAAHPAIHPTGDLPNKLEGRELKLYELIVRRFFSVFGEAAKRETLTVILNDADELFVTKGTRTKEAGWLTLYGPFVKFEEEEFSSLIKGETVNVDEIKLYDKETQPPKRYTEASLVKELEQENLGTKCLTGNTRVIVKSSEPKSVKISELFEQSFKIPEQYENNMALSINHLHECISLEDGKIIESHYPLISKRKLTPSEQVYNLTFADGSSLQATSEHPILCYENKQFDYKPLSQLTREDKAVAVHSWIDKTGAIVQTWEDFLKKCDLSTNLFANFDLRSFRKESQYAVAKLLSVKQSTISGWEQEKRVPIYVLRFFDNFKPDQLISLQGETFKNPFPLQVNSALSRILGNLIGDGYIDREKLKRENCYDFRYHNKNLSLINRFIKDINTLFGIQLSSKPAERGKYYVRVPAHVGRILAITSKELLTKDVSLLISSPFYPELIGALFDDEGHTTKDEPKIFISNTNFRMLEDLKRALLSLNIESTISKKQYKLYIRGKTNIALFLQQIPILSLTKKQRLISHLSRFYCYGGISKLLLQKNVLRILTESSRPSIFIASQLGLKQDTLRYHLNQLIHQGFIRKKTVGISQRPRKIILYELISNPNKTFHSFIGEELINEELMTKSIFSVNKIDYSGDVYDITNTPSSPNFMLDNHVLVHNSTRSAIIQNLYDRNYIHEKSIQVTDLGMRTILTLEKYCPEILDQALTRTFEEEMELIVEGKKTKEDIIDIAKKSLDKTLTTFKKHEKEIGTELGAATRETQDKESYLGKCKNCEEGNLHIRRGKFGFFAACNKYPDCKTTYPLPRNVKLKNTEKVCPVCQSPLVLLFKPKRKPLEYCISPECPSKKIPEHLLAIKKNCPKCQTELVLRRGAYGMFFACPKYPKCRHLEAVKEDKVEEAAPKE
ncbi:MAG: DNA topoisomerase I [Candidatus Nanoarchaeia archaeon]